MARNALLTRYPQHADPLNLYTAPCMAKRLQHLPSNSVRPATKQGSLEKPDLLCLDINRPKKNGIETLKELRESLPDLQVVMVSGDASTDKVKEAISLGAKGFILKPFNAQQVLSRLVQLFGEAPDQT